MTSEIVKIEHLKGVENWASWKLQIRVILNASDVWSVVNGDATRPVAVPSTDATAVQEHQKSMTDWIKADSIGQKVIGTSVGPQALLHIINCESAAEMWTKLKSIYEQKSETSIHMLQQMWYSATMDSTDSIASHIAKLEDIAHKLELLGEKVSDNMIITKILMTATQLQSFCECVGVSGSN